MKDYIQIGKRKVGKGFPVYIIAEMSANHIQNYDLAVEIIHAAHSSGADAVKLQTYTPDTLTMDCNNEYFQIKGTLWDGMTLYGLYRQTYTPWEWQPKLKKIANDLGMDLFSSPFDETAVDFLEKMNVPAYKIASLEIVDFFLLKRIARTKKPVIMSTGTAGLGEIDEAVRTLRRAGCKELALLKCTSAYPSLPEEMNIRTIPHLADSFSVPTGLSDHTLGIEIPIAAVALGACIIEKHFIISRDSSSFDRAFSLEPDEFKAMVDGVRIVEKALGSIRYEVMENEEKISTYRRSLFVTQDMKKGEQFSKRTVRSIRPGHGLHPKFLDMVLNKRAAMDIKKGTPLNWGLLDDIPGDS
ncbi:MAG: pseudaminic acid synthase [Deltaproteobacteria bacterium]|nr:pseudaminic acid synthase [Candidatus Zymogenaceae bacterium]